MIKAKYDYRMTIQEARVERCTELEESKATYSETISENVANHSLKSAMLCQEHREHMPELETRASSPTITQGKSPFYLLTSAGTIVVIPSIPYSHPCTSGGRAATLLYLSQTGT